MTAGLPLRQHMNVVLAPLSSRHPIPPGFPPHPPPLLQNVISAVAVPITLYPGQELCARGGAARHLFYCDDGAGRPACALLAPQGSASSLSVLPMPRRPWLHLNCSGWGRVLGETH